MPNITIYVPDEIYFQYLKNKEKHNQNIVQFIKNEVKNEMQYKI